MKRDNLYILQNGQYKTLGCNQGERGGAPSPFRKKRVNRTRFILKGSLFLNVQLIRAFTFLVKIRV